MRRAAPAVVLVVGAILTTFVAGALERRVDADVASRFEARTAQARGLLAESLDRLEALSLAVRAVPAPAGGAPSTADFARVLEGIDFPGGYPVVQGLSIIDVVPSDERATYLAARRSERPGYDIRPSGSRDGYRVIRHIVPVESNLAAFGFDVGTNPIAAAALDEAGRSGVVAVTEPTTLVQRPDRPGVILYTAIYDTSPPPTSVAERERSVVAYVAVATVVDDVLAASFADVGLGGIAVSVYDGEVAPDRLLGSWTASDEVPTQTSNTVVVDVAQRQWVARVEALPSLRVRSESQSTQLALLAGMVLTLVAAAGTSVLITAERRAQRGAMRATETLVANEEHLLRLLSRTESAEERFRTIVHSAPEATLVVASDGRITLANRRASEMFGYATEDLEGRPVDELLPQRFRASHREHRVAYTEDPRVRQMGEGRELFARRNDGSEFAVEISLSPLGASGEAIASIVDVTQRRADQRLLEAAAERERSAAEALRDSDRLKDEFLGIAAHELRTPLTAIGGFAEGLIRRWSSTPDEQRLDLLGRIARNAADMREMVERLLDFSRLQAGRVNLDRRPTDVGVLVREHAVALRERLGRTIEVTVEGDVVAEVDEAAIRHIFANLCGNAAKFSDPPDPIEVSVERKRAQVVLAVTDHGVGIPRQDVPHLFERFYQGENQAAGKRGTGIGLSIVHRYAKLHGGRAWIESELGVGTTVWVSVVVAASVADPTLRPEEPAS